MFIINDMKGYNSYKIYFISPPQFIFYELEDLNK